MGLQKHKIRIVHFVEMTANRDKVGKDLVGLVKALTEEMSMDFAEVFSGFVAMEEAEDLSLQLQGSPAHSVLFLYRESFAEISRG